MESCHHFLELTQAAASLITKDGLFILQTDQGLRFCPICDAFEAIDKRIAIVADGELGEREAQFLRHYSPRVTLLHIGPSSVATPANLPGLADIERLSINLSDLRIGEDRVSLSVGPIQRTFDVIYLALGCSAQHDLARSLGAK